MYDLVYYFYYCPCIMQHGSESCAALAQQRCVFVIALGRTGSTHLLRLLNEIPGFRVSGETDNAWIHFGRWHAQYQRNKQLNAQRAASSSHVSGGRAERTRKEAHDALHLGAPSAASRKDQQRLTQKKLLEPDVRSPVADADQQLVCRMRQLMLHFHNPAPRASVFGFKEIYSPFVRRPSLFSEVFEHGVEFVRALFPQAKFVFHSRRNLSRTATSDFWQQERTQAMLNQTQRVSHFGHVVQRYASYVREHPTHAFATTLEGLTDRYNTSEVEGLFRFLGVRLTPRLRRVARSHMVLQDWAEESHTRRIEHRAANGTLLRVEYKSFAFAPQA
jgi:hypothetical protein